MRIPHLEDYQGTKRLIVEDEPFIMIAGEVHNSTSSSPEAMEKAWDKADALGLNTLLVPVPWEIIEPVEGQFDFSIVDSLIAQARERRGRLGILWFGSWKNAQCMYAPGWVKADTQRFPRGQIIKGKNKAVMPMGLHLPYTTLSYLGEETMRADAAAFHSLMEHIRRVDEACQTVITVQVENETGLMGAAREQSDRADALFAGQVPHEFAKAVMGRDGTWEEVFEDYAHEAFSAYHISRFVEHVAAAGKEAYPLPFAVNAWIDKPGEVAGEYPSGGPVRKNQKIWKYNAPHIDLYCPDIYVRNFCDACEQYASSEYPLYIPECATHSYAGNRLLYTVGKHHAICYSPFGFESMGEPFDAFEGILFGMDTDDPALKTPQPVERYRACALALQSMMPMLTKAYGSKDLQAAVIEKEDENELIFEDMKIDVIFRHPFLSEEAGVCLTLRVSEKEFYIIADRCGIEFASVEEGRPNVDILLAEEGRFADGQWLSGRRLNGDETQFLKFDEPTILHIRLLTYA